MIVTVLQHSCIGNSYIKSNDFCIFCIKVLILTFSNGVIHSVHNAESYCKYFT